MKEKSMIEYVPALKALPPWKESSMEEGKKVITFKKPLSIDEQIQYLHDTKRVVYNEMSVLLAKENIYRFNYINVITPFKHLFAKTNETGVPIKENGKHVYERDVDFNEYFQQFKQEREKYPLLYKSLLMFEESFNAILSYEVIHFYDISDFNKFSSFINTLLSSLHQLPYKQTAKDHMANSIQKFSNELAKYNSPYIFFDRLTLSELITVFRCIDNDLQLKIFNSLVNQRCSIGYYDLETFDSVLPIIIQIRNYVCHGNSLEVLCMYYSIKDKMFRSRSDRRRYRNVIKRILKYE